MERKKQTGQWWVERKGRETEVSQQLSFHNSVLLVSQVNQQKLLGALAFCTEVYAAAEKKKKKITLANLGCQPFPHKYALQMYQMLTDPFRDANINGKCWKSTFMPPVEEAFSKHFFQYGRNLIWPSFLPCSLPPGCLIWGSTCCFSICQPFWDRRNLPSYTLNVKQAWENLFMSAFKQMTLFHLKSGMETLKATFALGYRNSRARLLMWTLMVLVQTYIYPSRMITSCEDHYYCLFR